jgi:hypothetical protein
MADDNWVNDSTITNTLSSANIGNTTYDVLYQNYKFVNPWTIPGNSSATWVRGGFPINSTFTLHLHFAETYFSTPKARVFDVNVNGTLFVDDMDVVAAVGPNNYVVRSGPVSTDNQGRISITLLNGYADYGMLAAIEVVNVGTPEFHTVLPIELVGFHAEVIPQGVEVTWATSSETQNEFFSVERSIDGRFFNEVARVHGAGSSTSLKEYQVVDRNPPPGLVYFRLRQTDFDGTSTHSATIAVTLEGLPNLELLNNPISEDRIRFRIPNNTRPFTYQLRDPQGRMISNGAFEGEQPIYEISLPALPTGIYHLSASGVFGSKREKVLVR